MSNPSRRSNSARGSSISAPEIASTSCSGCVGVHRHAELRDGGACAAWPRNPGRDGAPPDRARRPRRPGRRRRCAALPRSSAASRRRRSVSGSTRQSGLRRRATARSHPAAPWLQATAKPGLSGLATKRTRASAAAWRCIDRQRAVARAIVDDADLRHVVAVAQARRQSSSVDALSCATTTTAMSPLGASCEQLPLRRRRSDGAPAASASCSRIARSGSSIRNCARRACQPASVRRARPCRHRRASLRRARATNAVSHRTLRQPSPASRNDRSTSAAFHEP